VSNDNPQHVFIVLRNSRGCTWFLAPGNRWVCHDNQAIKFDRHAAYEAAKKTGVPCVAVPLSLAMGK